LPARDEEARKDVAFAMHDSDWSYTYVHKNGGEKMARGKAYKTTKCVRKLQICIDPKILK
jgi:hypothetical protein